MEQYYIIYPRGDETQLDILDFTGRNSYELDDWKRASRKVFYDLDEAIEYAKVLAKENGLKFSYSDGKNKFLD